MAKKKLTTHDSRLTTKLWGGAFRSKTHPAFEYFSSSLSEDYKLAGCDIRSSQAHCRMLRKIGVLKPGESSRILKALDAIHKDLARHETDFLMRKYEDIHSFIESELVKRAGEAAQKIHAARSRNDQVNQAMRMYCKERALVTAKLIGEVQAAILARAEEHRGLVVAGFTHLQKAQPVLLAHQFLGYVEALERAKSQLVDALKRIDILTLGSGALAGTSIPIDREMVRRELGFASLSPNSLDAVGSRDFLVEFVFVLAQTGVQLSRIAEDFLIGQIDEIGWFEIPEELCTGSSMMPQKRNPDFLELARGAAAILIGNLNALQVLLKGLPSSYNRDLQWDKAPLFNSTELVTQLLYLFRVFFTKLKVNEERAAASAHHDSLCATDLAEHLVKRGLPFRQAHERVGRLVRACLERGIRLHDAPYTLVEGELGVKMDVMRELFDPAASVSRKKGTGSTSPSEVARQIKKWKGTLKHASI